MTKTKFSEHTMTEDKENEEACKDSPHLGDAENVEHPKPTSIEEKIEKEIITEDNKEEEKETQKKVEVKEQMEEEQETKEGKVEKNMDDEEVRKDVREKNIKEEVDGETLEEVSLPKQAMVTANVKEETQENAPPKDPSNTDVSVEDVRKDIDMELHEDIPVSQNDKSEKDTAQEGADTIKASSENDIDSQINAPVLDPSLDNSMEVDKKIPMKAEGGPAGEGSVGPHAESLDGRKNLDNGSISKRNNGNDALHAGPSTLNMENVKEEVESEENVKERPMGMDNTEPIQTFLFDVETSEGGESGTEEEQSAFIKELESFFKEKSLEFKPPKFYGEPLNLLKLWRAVIKLGGYDKVTACKLWRQVGESFRPPKTCTTVSWTFRIFYEKALLDYEKHKIRGGELNIPASQSDPGSTESPAANSQASGSGRARRDAAARAMQGWHSQRLLGNGEVSDPIIKDKSSISLKNREKHLKNIGVQKRKRPSVVETPAKAVHPKVFKAQPDNTTIIDVGPPADWVKINVKTTKDCYEVYALVPGLLREEVRVQTDPAGRLVITGEPEHADNPWGVTPFKKIVSLPSRIDPHQTSAVVTLHGQLFVRVPFEQSD